MTLTGRIFKLFFIVSLSLTIGLSSLYWPQTAQAGASLYFSPTSKSLKVGESFSVTIYVNTNVSINTVDTIITFPASKLQATSTAGGSPFNDFGFAPAIDNANGTVRFLRAAFGGYTGSSGQVGGITFKAKAAGGGSLGFGVSTIGANDGQATNVYTGGGSASVTVTSNAASTPPPSSGSNNHTPPPTNETPPVVQQQPTSTATPTISSKTHPDSNRWYKDKKIEYSWSNTGDTYNYAIDQNAGTQLPADEKGAVTSASQTVSGDGVWYAHVRAKGSKGWSNTSHFKIQVDSTAPTDVVVSTQPESPMSVLPTFEMSAKDAGSGIQKYELRIDEGEWVEVKNGYKPKQLTSGEHTATVRVTDKAGNTAEGTSQFAIVPLAVPEVYSPVSGLLMLGEQFTISGKSLPGVMVELYINNELKETVATDEEGNYKSEEEYLLFPNTYEVAVKAVNKDGITSAMSEPVTVTVDAQAVNVLGMVLPGWGVFGALGSFLAALVAGIVWMALKLWRQTQMWAGRIRRLNEHLEKDLEELEKKLDERIDEAVGSVDPNTAASIKAAIEEEINQAEKEVDKSLESVTDESVPANGVADAASTNVAATVLSIIGGVFVELKGRLVAIKKKSRTGADENATEDKKDDKIKVKETEKTTQKEPEMSETQESKKADEIGENKQEQAKKPESAAENPTESQQAPALNGSDVSEDAKRTLAALEAKAQQQAQPEVTQTADSVPAMDKIPGVSDILTPEAELASTAETPIEKVVTPPPTPVEVPNAPGDALSALKKLDKDV